MMYWLIIAEKCIWFGLAALGFAVLFNVPTRTLFSIWLMGALAGGVKLLALKLGLGVILSSLAGATLVGILSIQTAHIIHSPPIIFAIPAVIPMVPGAFAYRTMLGLINLTGSTEGEAYTQLMKETIQNGLITVFILMSLAVGVYVPMLITRKDSAKHMKMDIGDVIKK